MPANTQPVSREAVLAVLEDALRRMLHKEANAARKGKARWGNFADWLLEFHATHRATLKDALAPSALLLECLGARVRPSELADYVVANSQLHLRQAHAECGREEFARRLDCWSGRARELAEELLYVYTGEPGPEES